MSMVEMAVSTPTHMRSTLNSPAASDPSVSAPIESPDIPSSNPPNANKHRPKSLSLSKDKDPKTNVASENADLALRIVSPGISMLNQEMESTVKISQEIELQQRNIIAARASSSVPNTPAVPNSTANTTSADSTASTTSVETSTGDVSGSPNMSKSQKVHTIDLDKLGAPAAAKRLKRDNIPTPLTINSAPFSSGPSSAYYKPMVQSAPIGHSRIPISARAPQRRVPPLPQLSTPVYTRPPQCRPAAGHPHPNTPAYYQQFYPSPVQRRQYRPIPNTQVVYSSLPPIGQPHTPHHPPAPQPATPFRRVRMVAPHTTTSPYFPRGIRNPRPAPQNSAHSFPTPLASANTSSHGSSASSHPSGSESKPFYVTDIYQGDLMKVAPLSSQPLSAQREFFEYSTNKPTPVSSASRAHKNLIDEDRLPVSDDEVREMQEKYRLSANEGARPRGVGYPPQYQSQHPYFPSVANTKPGEIFGSINLMNESVFNFRIFDQSSDKKTEKEVEDHAIEKESDEEQEKDEEKEKADEKDEVDADKEESDKDPERSTSPDNLEWLAKEKEKFMKICETSWDEFISSKRMASAW